MLKVIITQQNVKVPWRLKSAAVKAARIAAKCEAKGSSVSLMFTDDAGIQSLNRDFRQKDAATDVLSFPSGEAEFLGDIALSVQCAQRQADEYGHTLRREVAFLTVHAMLHLMGYDHENEGDEAAMRARQREILTEAGFERS